MSDHRDSPEHATTYLGVDEVDIQVRLLGAGTGWVGVHIQGGGIDLVIHGGIPTLRNTLVVELGRDLAHLEVAHRIDQATDGGEG